MRKLMTSMLLVASCLFAAQGAQAQNVLERILNNPKIQALLGKPADVTSLLGLCKNADYQRANSQACSEAAQADMVLKLPFEMRTVMGNQRSAQSLRDLCLAVQTTQQRDSYLCSELAKADTSFSSAMQNARTPLNIHGRPAGVDDTR
jgi:pantoate kinase